MSKPSSRKASPEVSVVAPKPKSIIEQLNALNIEEKSPPPSMKDEFKPWGYQTEVVNWMKHKERSPVDGVSGGIVALMMGLGKTLIALLHIISARKELQEEYPTLVVMSKTLLYEWKRQGVEKFFNNVKALYFHKDLLGAAAARNFKMSNMKGYDIVFTTYDVLMGAHRAGHYDNQICERGDSGFHKDKIIAIHHRHRPEFDPDHRGPKCFYEMPWERIICDESQRFANPKTVTFRSLMAIYAKYRWCLTGTPIRNYNTDIWAQLRFCGFNRILHSRLWKRRLFDVYDCRQHLNILNYEKAEVVMPPKIEEVTVVKMDVNQAEIYATMLLQLQNVFAEFCAGKAISYTYILALFTRLRQIAIAPHLIVAKREETEKGIAENRASKVVNNLIKSTPEMEDWIKDSTGSAGVGSPKIREVVRQIKALPAGSKALVFSMFTSSLALVERALDAEEIVSASMIGSTNVAERLSYMGKFKESKDLNVMLLHYKVGGEGLNLTEATHVFPLEPWWTHAVHNQGIFRAWRRGQNRPVTIHWVLTDKTIESNILRMCENKQGMADSYLYGTDMPDDATTGLSRYELGEILDRR